MLDSIFTHILDGSMTASFVILVVMLLRLFLRRTPKIFSYALWSVVLLRLLCPFSVESPVGLVPEMTSVSESYTLSQTPVSERVAGQAAYEAVGDLFTGGTGTQEIRTGDPGSGDAIRYVAVDWKNAVIFFGKYVWLAGILALLLSSGISYGKLRKRIATAKLLRENIYLADTIPSPFVVGILRPKIYLPAHLSRQEQSYILLHEQHHIRRLDPVWKMLAFVALTLHWFNPLVWAAFFLAGKDMEMSCDEAVIGKLGLSVRADYADSLLNLATGKHRIAGMPLAFGEGDTRGRIRNLAKWKRPAVWILVAVAVVCGILGVCLVTNRADAGENTGMCFYAGTVTGLDAQSLTLCAPDGEEIVLSVSEEFPSEFLETYVLVKTRAGSNGGRLAVSVMSLEKAAYPESEDAIEQAILLINSSSGQEDTLPTVSFARLAERKKAGSTTVYGLAYFCVYRLEGESLHTENASHIPVAITFRQNDTGEYELAEYWEPRDGNLYVDDIRAKFPLGVWPDTQKYLRTQMRNSYAQAAEVFGRDVVIQTILEDIREREQWAEDFESLMEMCRSQRELLCGYGEDTLLFCFAKLEAGTEDALTEQIMAYVCGEILEELGEPDLPDWSGGQPGQAWFQEFAELARHRLASESELSAGALEERFPGSWFYLKYTGNVASSAANWGISLRGEKITADGMTLLISRQENLFPGELSYGNAFSLQRQEQDTWVEVPILGEEPVWTTEAHTIPRGKTVSLPLNWAKWYGTLQSGTYRVGITITGMLRPGEAESYVFYLNFEIRTES